MRTLQQILIDNPAAVIIKPATLGVTTENYMRKCGSRQGYVVVIEDQQGHINILTASTMEKYGYVDKLGWDGNGPIITILNEVVDMIDNADISFNIQDAEQNKLYELLDFFYEFNPEDMVEDVYHLHPKLK